MKNFAVLLALVTMAALSMGAWAASKSRPQPDSPGVIFKKVSPHLSVSAELEPLESRYGRRLVLSLTAHKDYDRLNYQVEFLPELDLLDSSPLQGERSLTASESLVLNFVFDIRDAKAPLFAQVLAYEEMADRKRHGISEVIEILKPEVSQMNSSEPQPFPPEKARRILQ